MPPRKNRKTDLKVFFDTNVLYTKIASDLVTGEVAGLLKSKINDPALSIQYFFPEIVLNERRYQMFTKAKELLPTVQKLERLLGHSLAMSEEILADRVSAAIERQCKDLSITVAVLDHRRVDWPKIIDSSVNRRPPFEAGETEKGFRDALAIETFLQEVERSPKSPSVCRLAFISEDGLVRDTLKERTTASSNVRILSSLEELQGLINTLTSEIDEQLVAALLPIAGAIFFTKSDNKSSLFYTGAVYEQIQERFGVIFNKVPDGVTSLKHLGTTVSRPNFKSKSKAVIRWVTRITIEQELQVREDPPPPPPSQMTYGGTAPSTNFLKALAAGEGFGLQPSTTSNTLANLLMAQPNLKSVGKRAFKFSVVWTTRMGPTHLLTAAKIESIDLEADPDSTPGLR